MSKDSEHEKKSLFAGLKALFRPEKEDFVPKPIVPPAPVAPSSAQPAKPQTLPGGEPSLDLANEMSVFAKPPTLGRSVTERITLPKEQPPSPDLAAEFEFLRPGGAEIEETVPAPKPPDVHMAKDPLSPPPPLPPGPAVSRPPVEARIAPPPIPPQKSGEPEKPKATIPGTVPEPPQSAKKEELPLPRGPVRSGRVMAPELAVQMRRTAPPAPPAPPPVPVKQEELKKEPISEAKGKTVPLVKPPVETLKSEAGAVQPTAVPSDEFRTFSGAELDKIRMPAESGKPAAGSKQTVRRVELEANRERKKKPRVILPPPEAPPRRRFHFMVPEFPRSVRWWALGLVLLGVGIGTYLYLRETSVIAHVVPGDLQIVDRPAVVYNFTGKLSLLKSDYAKRVHPLEEQLKGIEDDLAAAQADMAGRQERKKSLEGQISGLEAEIPRYVDASQTELDALWKTQGAALDREYADTKESLQKEIEDRAKKCGLKYERNKDIDALEVAVNSYKLSLYAAPKGVKVDEERAFGEDILSRWKKFEADWQIRQAAIKAKALEIKKEPAPKIDETRARIDGFKTDLSSLETELVSLQDEVDRYSQAKKEMEGQIEVIVRQFVTDLLAAPNDFIKMKYPIEADATVQMHNLQDKSLDLPPGNYIFFVQAKSPDQIYWAMKEFAIKEYERTQIDITRQDFVPARSFLK
ncbi:MAG: hypothetical protein PHD76_11415 [Methylacidiphilales bacterium]|nr:hypothetical protein [Candidatus Methylacidiphilales bacterium]